MDSTVSKFDEMLSGWTSPEESPLEQKLRKDIREKGTTLVSSAFGDMEGHAGYVEMERVSERGYEQKFYGCSYWFKGHTDKDFVFTIGRLKRNVISAFHLAIRYPFLLLLPKKAVLGYIRDLYLSDLHYRMPPENELKPVEREVIRVGKLLIKDEIMLPLVYCFSAFLEDYPYCSRFQDAMSVSENLKEFLNVLLERERDESLIKKWKLVKKASYLLIFAPKTQCFIERFIQELNKNKIAMDKDDFYFSLNRERYDFFGLPHKERVRMRDEMDKEAGNQIIKV